MARCAEHDCRAADAGGFGFSVVHGVAPTGHAKAYRCAIRCAAAPTGAASAVTSPRDARRALALLAFFCLSASETWLGLGLGLGLGCGCGLELTLHRGDLREVCGAVAPPRGRALVPTMHGDQSATRILELPEKGVGVRVRVRGRGRASLSCLVRGRGEG